jgi:hypothetical protein
MAGLDAVWSSKSRRPFKVPVLVVVTHQGGNRYEYAGMRLY